MRKNLLLLCLATLSSLLVKAQTAPTPTAVPDYISIYSGTEIPSQQWNDWFNKEVEKFEKNMKNGRAASISYEIPVVFHIVHYGQTVGTFPNIDSNQVKSQVAVLNADYAGTGLNYTNVPIPFANLETNTGIRFCRAKKDPNGIALLEPGIHRVNANSSGWPNPSTPTVNIVNFINFIKPYTIWDPTKYLNIWISDRSPNTTIIGMATYPAGTTLNGIPTSGGTAADDGVWCWAKATGSVGTLQAPHDKGRTLTKEIAHWLGVRNIWGDGNCLDDYCTDTPWGKQPNYGYYPYPSFVNRCGTNQSPFGEMTMNFMDETDDTCRYMFTPRQAARMQTAMSQGTFRTLLGTHGLCTPQTIPNAPAVAGFVINEVPCVGQPFTPLNTSTGGPAPGFAWSTTPAAGNIYPAPSVANPAITFNSPGTYTIYLVATNTVNVSTYSMVITPAATCPSTMLCLDTIRIIKKTDTLRTYAAPNSSFVVGCQSGFAGRLVGTNCFNDKEFAQFIPANTYSAITLPQVNSVIVLFDSLGTRSNTNSPNTMISCKLYSGTMLQGPNSQLVVTSDSLRKITRSPKTTVIKYCGTPTYTFTTTKVIPFKFDFPQPYVLSTTLTGYYVAVEAPYQSPGDSINIFSNTKTNPANDSTSWVLLNPSNNWKTLRYSRGAKVNLAMLPQMTCRPAVGIAEIPSEFESNITVMPNPNNGVFSIVFLLPKEEKITVTTYNAIGQKVGSDQLENVSHNMVNMDLSQKPDGVYFIHLSNGTDRVIKKVIVTH